jgi:lactate dehydrogenase-like 2-hydroxyacid dehydrogenase
MLMRAARQFCPKYDLLCEPISSRPARKACRRWQATGDSRRAAHGFGMQVLYASRTRLDADIEDGLKCRFVDELALAAALYNGYLGAAALDDFVEEPRVRPELLQSPRLLLIPHIASAMASARLSTLHHAALEGRTPADLLNREVLA